ncbi:hypothetical protein DXG01_007051, partial [Tephrocybe rancida]
IQQYRASSGLSWDVPADDNDPGLGVNITTPEEKAVWEAMVKTKVRSSSVTSSDKRKKVSLVKGKAKTTSPQSSTHSASGSTSSVSTAKRVEKLTPAAAIVSLEGSVNTFTTAIQEAAKPPKTAEDRAAERRLELPDLIKKRSSEDGLTRQQQAKLLVYFSQHSASVEMYFGMHDPETRLDVVLEWIVSMPAMPLSL